MGWRRAVATMISAVLFVIGLSSLPEDLARWISWLQWVNSNSGRTALVVFGILLLLTAWDVPQRLWLKFTPARGTPKGEIYTRTYQLRYANVLGVGAEILSQYGRSPGMNETAKTITWRGPAQEHEEIQNLIAADDTPHERWEPVRLRLEQATKTGNALLGSVVTQSTRFSLVSVDDNLTRQMEQWTEEVYSYLTEHLPEYAADFLSSMPNKVGLFGLTVSQVADVLRQRLANLRNIIHACDHRK